MPNRLKSSYPLLVLILKKWQTRIYSWNMKTKTFNFTFTLQFFNSNLKTSWGSSIFKKVPLFQKILSISGSNPHLMAPTLLRWKVERIRTWRVKRLKEAHDRTSTERFPKGRWGGFFRLQKEGIFSKGNEIFTMWLFRIFWNPLWYSWLMAIDWKRIFGLVKWRIHNAQKVAMERSIIKISCRM